MLQFSRNQDLNEAEFKNGSICIFCQIAPTKPMKSIELVEGTSQLISINGHEVISMRRYKSHKFHLNSTRTNVEKAVLN